MTEFAKVLVGPTKQVRAPRPPVLVQFAADTRQLTAALHRVTEAMNRFSRAQQRFDAGVLRRSRMRASYRRRQLARRRRNRA